MIITISLALIAISVLLCTFRMLAGPSSADRAMSVDTLATVTISLLVILSFVFKRYIYLDVALVYAVLAFIGSVVIARYLERGL
jgi:multicomponent Na+:H+ antiporter subunit F